MEYLVINTGIIGLSEGNGHPFSFSAIINGYDKIELKKSGWKVIYDYLQTISNAFICFGAFLPRLPVSALFFMK